LRAGRPGAGETGATWLTITVKTEKISGVHALWLRFYGEGEELFTVDWLKFFKTEK